MAQENKSTVGEKIWVESLMTPAEWNQRHKVGYGSSIKPWPPKEFDCEFKWRKGMGATLNQEEIKRINDNLDKLHEFVKSKQHG